jgi:hypothetical protein
MTFDGIFFSLPLRSGRLWGLSKYRDFNIYLHSFMSFSNYDLPCPAWIYQNIGLTNKLTVLKKFESLYILMMGQEGYYLYIRYLEKYM